VVLAILLANRAEARECQTVNECLTELAKLSGQEAGNYSQAGVPTATRGLWLANRAARLGGDAAVAKLARRVSSRNLAEADASAAALGLLGPAARRAFPALARELRRMGRRDAGNCHRHFPERRGNCAAAWALIGIDANAAVPLLRAAVLRGHIGAFEALLEEPRVGLPVLEQALGGARPRQVVLDLLEDLARSTEAISS
jgi:hypothetical protein